MKRTVSRLLLLAGIITMQFACKKDNDIIIVPPSEGETLTLNGGTGGASAVNSVFVDFSTNKQDSVKRNSWNLGFAAGSDFRVILNSTNGSSAVVVNKTDINAVTATDIHIDDLNIPLGTAGAFSNIDDVITDALSKTLIAGISATDADNKVYVINPEGGSHASTLEVSKLMKIRVLRKASGYSLQYAQLNATSFNTIDVIKDPTYNFKFFSFTNGFVSVQPEKAKWDLMWTWSIYYGGSGVSAYPYGYSDLVFTNHLGGVQASEKIYSASDVRNAAFTNYNTDSIATTSFSGQYDVIGSKWRATTGTIGVKTDRFYVIKDAAGNVYKLKFISFTTQDGGTRGKPVVEYKLVKKG